MKFHLFVTALIFLLLFSCGGDVKPQNPKGAETDAKEEMAYVTAQDTVLKYFGQNHLDSIPLSSDTTFLIDGEQFTLRMELALYKQDTVYYDEPFVNDESVEIVRYYGRDVQYVFQLLDSKDAQVWKKTFRKKDYMEELGSIVAQSNMHLPRFETFLKHTGQIVLTQEFNVPESCTGLEGLLLFTKSGDAKIKFHRSFGSSGGECDVQYSSDSTCLLTCAEIITSKGTTSLEREGANLAGNMFVGKSHIFAAYVFCDESSSLGGRLYTTSGKLVKEFVFDGYSAGLGYNLPRTYNDQVEKYYFVDEPNKFLMIIPENNPVAIQKVPFSKVRVAPNPQVHPNIVLIETEVSQHKIGLNAKGEIIAHQMRHYGDEWKFYDEIKY